MNYVGQNGFADTLLHYGSKESPVAEIELDFETDEGKTTYFARWAAAAGGTLRIRRRYGQAYLQCHEFEALVLTDPRRVGTIYDFSQE